MLLFVAAEMLLAEIIEIRPSASLAVIVCIFGIAIVASRSFPVPRRRAEEQTGGRSQVELATLSAFTLRVAAPSACIHELQPPLIGTDAAMALGYN